MHKGMRKMMCGYNAGINLTSYHPPQANRWATNFFRQNPHPGTAFQYKTLAPGSKKLSKIPTPGDNFAG